MTCQSLIASWFGSEFYWLTPRLDYFGYGLLIAGVIAYLIWLAIRDWRERAKDLQRGLAAGWRRDLAKRTRSVR